MRISITATTAFLACAAALAPLGCYRSADPGDETETDTGPDVDADADADTDVDTGTDVDTDADADADVDTDTDSDTDSDSDGDDDCGADVPTGAWGNACDPSGSSSECAPDMICVTLDGTTGYCAPQCCALGEVDPTYCTDLVTGTEQCAVYADSDDGPFYCVILCDGEEDCPEGTACTLLAATYICTGFADTDADTDGGTWDDPATGLVWQNPPSTGTFVWETALAHCDVLNLAGFDDWRLPSIQELISLLRGCVDGTATGDLSASECPVTDPGCLSDACGDVGCGYCDSLAGPDDDPAGCYWPPELEAGYCTNYVWSSSTLAGDASLAWFVNFELGYAYTTYKVYDQSLRCVRGEL